MSIRKDGVIRVRTLLSIRLWRFTNIIIVCIKNTHYDNKWFYAYITDVKYINDGCTEYQLKLMYFKSGICIIFKHSLLKENMLIWYS